MDSPLQANKQVRILRGRYKDAIVTVVKQEHEVAGFWWCRYNDRSGGHLVVRDVLLNANQLEPVAPP